MKPENYHDTLLMQEYITRMRPVFNKRAVFSDETGMYRDPAEPKRGQVVKIRLRTARNNADEVWLISGLLRQKMEVEYSQDGFDYYATKLQLGSENIHYYFEITAEKLRCYYNQLGVTRDLQEYYSFTIAPGFTTPDWAKGAVMYQIYTDRFRNGNPDNDVQTKEYYYIGGYSIHVDDWYRMPENMDVRDFYGGDIQGIMDKLDYLQDLGIEVIYLNPVFISPSNHKYDSQDYDHIDPHYTKIVHDGGDILSEGDTDNSHATKYIERTTNTDNLEASNQFFADFIAEVHRRGMRVILDGVFNHCGSFNKWIDRERIYEKEKGYKPGAYISEDSPYRSFFKFNNEHEWPYNEFYDGWWGHDTLPKLNYEGSPKLFEYIMHIAEKWVSPPFCADGWRLDVAADLGHSEEYNHFFWREFRKRVKAANPNAIILAEHYGSPRAWLSGDQWDTVMNYDAFMEPVSWFLTGMEKHSDEYREDLLGNAEACIGAMREHMSSFIGQSFQCAMNELSNHDHSRFLTRTNHKVGRVQQLGSEAASEGVDKAIFRVGVAMQFTMTGAPTIYYGDEAGVCGFTDPDNRRTYPWDREDGELIRFHRDLIAIHKKYTCLRTGSLKELGGRQDILFYARFSEQEQAVIAINRSEIWHEVEIPVWEAGLSRIEEYEMHRVFKTDAEGYTIREKAHPVIAGILKVSLPPKSAEIFVKK